MLRIWHVGTCAALRAGWRSVLILKRGMSPVAGCAGMPNSLTARRTSKIDVDIRPHVLGTAACVLPEAMLWIVAMASGTARCCEEWQSSLSLSTSTVSKHQQKKCRSHHTRNGSIPKQASQQECSNKLIVNVNHRRNARSGCECGSSTTRHWLCL